MLCRLLFSKRKTAYCSIPYPNITPIVFWAAFVVGTDTDICILPIVAASNVRTCWITCGTIWGMGLLPHSLVDGKVLQLLSRDVWSRQVRWNRKIDKIRVVEWAIDIFSHRQHSCVIERVRQGTAWRVAWQLHRPVCKMIMFQLAKAFVCWCDAGWLSTSTSCNETT